MQINYDLKLRGVNSVNVSDSQEVIIYPRGKELTLKKNRDFDFSGVVQAGRFDIMGSNFGFKYDDFMIDMPNVDIFLSESLINLQEAKLKASRRVGPQSVPKEVKEVIEKTELQPSLLEKIETKKNESLLGKGE